MVNVSFSEARILIVDDRAANLRLLDRLLTREGYSNIRMTSDPLMVREACDSWDPDIVLLDLQMPDYDGFQVLEELAPILSSSKYLPILVLMADQTPESKRKSLAMGAKDFLAKPFDPTEVLLRIHNLLETRFLHQKLRGQNQTLEDRVAERTSELESSVRDLEDAHGDLRRSQEETIQRLGIAAEYRDDDTGQHIQRMSHYCALLARAFGFDDERSQMIRLASQMHDVGKIGTPDEILLKPGKLTEEERAVMQEHCVIGHGILEGSSSQLLQLAATIALTHHERPDGKGYPHGLRGAEIPIEGRIAAIADVFDALTSDRVYRKAFPINRAVDIMEEGRGTQFDSALLEQFFDALPTVDASPPPRSTGNRGRRIKPEPDTVRHGA